MKNDIDWRSKLTCACCIDSQYNVRPWLQYVRYSIIRCLNSFIWQKNLCLNTFSLVINSNECSSKITALTTAKYQLLVRLRRGNSKPKRYTVLFIQWITERKIDCIDYLNDIQNSIKCKVNHRKISQSHGDWLEEARGKSTWCRIYWSSIKKYEIGKSYFLT